MPVLMELWASVGQPAVLVKQAANKINENNPARDNVIINGVRMMDSPFVQHARSRRTIIRAQHVTSTVYTNNID